eukprot:347819-Chlamydomonas_euryale.AAC.1
MVAAEHPQVAAPRRAPMHARHRDRVERAVWETAAAPASLTGPKEGCMTVAECLPNLKERCAGSCGMCLRV